MAARPPVLDHATHLLQTNTATHLRREEDHEQPGAHTLHNNLFVPPGEVQILTPALCTACEGSIVFTNALVHMQTHRDHTKSPRNRSKGILAGLARASARHRLQIHQKGNYVQRAGMACLGIARLPTCGQLTKSDSEKQDRWKHMHAHKQLHATLALVGSQDSRLIRKGLMQARVLQVVAVCMRKPT